ncbi:MAG: pyruvate kinase [Burkholderiales bacterium]|nr:pyruvate kinase [Burkholderiales bacterium]
MPATRRPPPPRAPETADLRWRGGAPDVPGLLARIRDLRAAVRAAARAQLRRWAPHLVDPAYRASAANLAAYIALRRHDLRPIQRYLASLGLSSLGRCEGHVRASLDAVAQALERMVGQRVPARRLGTVARAMAREQALLRRNADRLFGPPPAPRWTRFMVTLATEAATDYAFVRELVRHGMDVARINCAHDAPAQWIAMARHVRRAARETGRACRVLMDLAGPKLRTGPVRTGRPVLRIRAARDAEGTLLRPGYVVLDATGAPGRAARKTDAGAIEPARLAVDAGWLAPIRPGDRIRLTDLRGRERVLVVEKRLSARELLARAEKTAYVAEGALLEHLPQDDTGSRPGTVGALLAEPLDIRVGPGDALLLTREPEPGEPARSDPRGRPISPAHIACSEPRVFSALRSGHRVWIDDGRIGAVIETVDERGAWLRITHARPQGERIRAGKGLNFPDSTLPLPPLGETDLADLDVVARHADLVGHSFVREPDDVSLLARELERRGRPDIGIVAKIETRAAVRNLAEIIVRGAGRGPFGVMIARGDLAVEIGYERLAEVQEEILWLCEAAHVPVIWATQVLENLVKQGRPSRAEMTDAAVSGRAECVMLNKGPYLVQALQVLGDVVTRMQALQRKKTAQFRPRLW